MIKLTIKNSLRNYRFNTRIVQRTYVLSPQLWYTAPSFDTHSPDWDCFPNSSRSAICPWLGRNVSSPVAASHSVGVDGRLDLPRNLWEAYLGLGHRFGRATAPGRRLKVTPTIWRCTDSLYHVFGWCIKVVVTHRVGTPGLHKKLRNSTVIWVSIRRSKQNG